MSVNNNFISFEEFYSKEKIYEDSKKNYEQTMKFEQKEINLLILILGIIFNDKDINTSLSKKVKEYIENLGFPKENQDMVIRAILYTIYSGLNKEQYKVNIVNEKKYQENITKEIQIKEINIEQENKIEKYTKEIEKNILYSEKLKNVQKDIIFIFFKENDSILKLNNKKDIKCDDLIHFVKIMEKNQSGGSIILNTASGLAIIGGAGITWYASKESNDDDQAKIDNQFVDSRVATSTDDF